MKLLINNAEVAVADDPPRLLLWVIRDELGLTGTKYGCGAGICGACTVLVDGRPIRSCITPLADVADGAIQTIEGLAKTLPDGTIQLHPVQDAFLDGQVPQCSWCMSGQMLTAAAFLAENPRPSDADIVAAMSRNYCRCGCYARIRTAVADAAGRLAATGADHA